jgi:hypothetical protein
VTLTLGGEGSLVGVSESHIYPPLLIPFSLIPLCFTFLLLRSKLVLGVCALSPSNSPYPQLARSRRSYPAFFLLSSSPWNSSRSIPVIDPVILLDTMIFYLPLLTLLVPALAAPVHSSLPIPPRSTLSHISCLPHPPFTPHWTIEQDPHKCLALCGSLSPDFSAVIRARTTYGSGIGSPQPRLDEYDCLCAETTLLDATPLTVNDHSCGSGGWVAYTPILPWDAMNLPQQKYEHRLAADRGQRAYQALMKDRLRKRPSLAACPDGFKVCPSADGDGSFEVRLLFHHECRVPCTMIHSLKVYRRRNPR